MCGRSGEVSCAGDGVVTSSSFRHNQARLRIHQVCGCWSKHTSGLVQKPHSWDACPGADFPSITVSTAEVAHIRQTALLRNSRAINECEEYGAGSSSLTLTRPIPAGTNIVPACVRPAPFPSLPTSLASHPLHKRVYRICPVPSPSYVLPARGFPACATGNVHGNRHGEAVEEMGGALYASSETPANALKWPTIAPHAGKQAVGAAPFQQPHGGVKIGRITTVPILKEEV